MGGCHSSACSNGKPAFGAPEGSDAAELAPLRPVPTEPTYDLAKWEREAKAPTLYDPPQTKSRCCLMNFGLCILRSSCCGLAPIARCCCYSCCCQRQYGRITEPDAWFTEMLTTRVHKNCPEFLLGVWWLYDNPGAENLVTLQDADWISPDRGLKINRYNWTVDANNIFGSILTANYWVNGGNLLLEVSPNRRWVRATIWTGGSNWIYVLQPGDELRGPDGSLVDFVPGEDLLRISYVKDDQSSKVKFQYLMRRVAYLDAAGRLVKTKYYDELRKVAQDNSLRWCCSSQLGDYLQDEQAFTHTPTVEYPSAR